MVADEVVAVAADDAWFAARMTQIQFAALAARLKTGRVLDDITNLPHFGTLRRGAQCDPRLVRQWLLNGWSTENLLRINLEHLEGDALSHSLHWAFPQAYYSVYSLTMAYFQTVGYSEQSHTAVIRKFGTEAVCGRYPATVSFALVGGKSRSFHHIEPIPLTNNLQFDESSPDDCNGRICQFLNATRDLDLSSKKADLKFKTARGTHKKKLKPHEWQRVSDQLGPTSLLSLLYRKRLKVVCLDVCSLEDGPVS